MFADPQSVTINAVSNPLPRIDQGDQSATYKKDDDTLALVLSHLTTKNGRIRHMARIDFNKFSADPFIPAENRKVAGSAYLVIDEPEDGSYTNAELLTNVKGLLSWLNDANVTKLLAGES